MFAYCGNNPVSKEDPTGTISVISFLDKDNSLSAAWLALAAGVGGNPDLRNCIKNGFKGNGAVLDEKPLKIFPWEYCFLN